MVAHYHKLLFAPPETPLSEIMLHDPFALRPEMTLVEAMREVWLPPETAGSRTARRKIRSTLPPPIDHPRASAPHT